MVKIPELKDKQLIAQIHKYDKILKSLLRERKRRIAKGTKPETLMTPSERQVAKKMQEKGKIKSEVSIGEETQTSMEQPEDNLDQNAGLELSPEMEEQVNAVSASEVPEDDDEEESEVRVTQLLQLSQDQIKDFKEKSLAAQKNKKTDKKKKKKGLFGL